jgi:hypothetical protein
LTPQSSQRQPACLLTHLDILPQRAGYSVRRSGAASFTMPTPETTAANKLLTTTDACLGRVHADDVGLVRLKRKRGY